MAEDIEDIDFELELEFSRQQKSTLENFPLQAIDQETLSDTAIAGALQVQTQSTVSTGENGKPIYQEQSEGNQKKQVERLSDTKRTMLSEDEILKFSQNLPTQPRIQPIYQQPTGRTYVDHQTTTLSRP